MRLRLLTLCCVLQFYLKYINKSSHCEEGDIEMSPSSMVEKRRSTESGSLRDNCKRTKSGASPLKDKIKIILAASSGSSIKECMAMVHNMEGIATGSQFYCYVCNFLCNKDACTVFDSVKNGTVRLKWLMYNYETW
ncbi:uncharacterized protein LOC111400886 [Olea europaea var. sylvestris]|uniref:uncharacterized protein LOC111400886 n=1 Tax=Olea europaea var. sylvestris TaxID=158386 RepID=UPI000C1D19DA|nr:uncharacterized protein LOC111400886 [Olea europaea var. sylvestris]